MSQDVLAQVESKLRQNDVISHHGVKGQRWGVRRAKSNVSKASTNPKTNSSAKELSKASTARERSWKTSYKKRGQMSNDQLKKQVDRLRLESEFKRLSSEVNKGQQSAGQKFISDIKANTLAAIVDQVPKATVKFAIDSALPKSGGKKK